jgi:hypothetical protein
MIGFLEEAEGVRSSTRLFTLLLIALTAVLVGTICVYVLKVGVSASAAVIAALVGGITSLGAWGSVAIYNRNHGDDAK